MPYDCREHELSKNVGFAQFPKIPYSSTFPSFASNSPFSLERSIRSLHVNGPHRFVSGPTSLTRPQHHHTDRLRAFLLRLQELQTSDGLASEVGVRCATTRAARPLAAQVQCMAEEENTCLSERIVIISNA